MEDYSPFDDRPLRIPPIVWILGAALVAALVAIFIFKVSVGNVIYYGAFLLMIGSHFFMHGSHGGHGNSSGHQHDSMSNTTESNKNEHSGHTGGCH